jgi:hypothetical protein
MTLKQNQFQGTTIKPQANAIIEWANNDIIRSFDLENNHQNLKEQEFHSLYFFLQSNAWLSSY